MKKWIAAAVLILLPALVWPSPVGRWKTVDDETGEVKSIVRVWEENGSLKGQVEELFDPEHPTCENCTGENKGKPITGMVVLWGLRPEDGEWTGGRALDPKNGKTYKCRLRLIGEGKKLVLRGYIGVSWIGRSQTWLRTE